MPTLKGTAKFYEGVIVYVEDFLYLVSSSMNVSMFPYHMAGCLLDRPRISGMEEGLPAPTLAMSPVHSVNLPHSFSHAVWPPLSSHLSTANRKTFPKENKISWRETQS